MESDEYEELVSTIATSLTNEPGLIDKPELHWGSGNFWQGASGFRHQIDVSLENERHVLLVECKCWNEGNRPKAEDFLTIWARVMDIEKGPASRRRVFRGALVSSSSFQSGVETLRDYYRDKMSLFIVNTEGKVAWMRHMAFASPKGIASEETFGQATVTSTPPD